MTEHQLFLFLAEVTVLVVAARMGGELALRLRIPQVVGELVFGIMLGPSLFGALWPGGFRALFPADPTQRSLLEIVSWVGVIFLVLLTGLETRLSILRKAGKAVAAGWLGGFFLPLLVGFAFGLAIPSRLIPADVERPVFALFIATAMSISAIPVIARILMDLDLFRTRIGMVIVSTAVADDTVGWILLAVITGLVERHRLDVATVATALLGTAAFLLFAFTVGQWLVNRTLRAAESFSMPFAKTTAVLVIVFVGGAMTQAIHVHLVLGSFVAGILVFRSPARERGSVEPLRTVGMSFFVPLFFAYTGIKVDLTTLRGSTLAVAVLAVGLACISKFLGSVVGARLGGLSKWEALAAGAGRNARGAMELVIAAIGLSIGVLSLPMYSIVVLIAVVTTLMAAPILRACVRRIPEDGTRVPGTEKEKGRVSA